MPAYYTLRYGERLNVHHANWKWRTSSQLRRVRRLRVGHSGRSPENPVSRKGAQGIGAQGRSPPNEMSDFDVQQRKRRANSVSIGSKSMFLICVDRHVVFFSGIGIHAKNLLFTLAVISFAVGCTSPTPPPIPFPESYDGMDAELADAISRLRSTVEQDRSIGSNCLVLAQTYHANGLSDLAEQTYAIFLQFHPNDAKAWNLRGQALVALGRLDEAESCFQQSIQLRPDVVSSLWRLALVKIDQGDSLAALKFCDAALKIAAADQNATLIRAKCLIDLDRAEEALESLPASELDKFSNAGYARFLTGTALRQLGQMEESATYLSQDNLRPQWSDPWRSEISRFEVGFSNQRIKASAFYRQGKYDSAIAIFQQCIKNPQSDSRDWNLLAAAYLAKGDTANALQTFERGLEVFPNEVDLNTNLAKLYMGQVPIRGAASLSKAITLLEKVCRLRPEQWQFHDLLGQALNMRGDLDAAYAAYDRACRAARSVEMCHWRKIFVLLDQRKSQAAKQELEGLQDSQSDSPYFLFASADVARQQADLTAAKQWLEKIDVTKVSDKALLKKIERLKSGLDFSDIDF